MRSAFGFSLLEVLFALIVISVGLLGFAGTLGPAAALAGRGKRDTRVALIAESRMHRFRVALAATGTGCALPPGGTQQHGAGLRETWSAIRVDSLVELRIILESHHGAATRSDSVVTRMPCP